MTGGVLEGTVRRGLRMWRGIPYASAPVGELRFRAPAAVTPWAGIRDASEFGPIAPQDRNGQFRVRTNAPMSEDCLTLNVIAPAEPGERMPVMVFVHGGAYSVGSAREIHKQGEGLVRSGGVIFVNFNYRLGALGYLDFSSFSTRSHRFDNNLGLRDQVAALEWVRDNIAAFGGDPDNVTIFGESAGSFDVCYHVASPLSRGLFHRAISQSGGCTTRQPTVADGEQRTASLIDAVGCGGAADVLDCLRALPVSTLLANSSGFPPIVDGGFLPDQPRTLFDNGDIAPVPYILGSNSDEGTLFLLATPPVTTEAEYLAALAARYGERADAIAALYPAGDFATPNAALARVVGDSGLVCGTYDSARRAAAAGSSVYLYNFDWPVLTDVLPFLGATHGAEIAFVFGSVTAPSAEDTAVAQSMQGYWTRFARSGDPNGEGALAWPLYDDASDQRINFAAENSVVSGFRRAQCELWWGFYDEDFE